MGCVRWGVPRRFIEMLRSREDFPTFVETGTFRGRTLKWAASVFVQSFSIEADQQLFRRAEKSFASSPHVKLLFGNSMLKLQEVVALLKGPAVFWLDAHHCGGRTYGANVPCPLIEEIQIINGSPFDHVLLIDDARFFLYPPLERHMMEQWPDIASVIKALSFKERYIVAVDDVIIAVPARLKDVAVQYASAYGIAPWAKFSEKLKKALKSSMPWVPWR